MTNPVSYTYLWLPLIAYRSFDGFFVKAYEDQGYQEGTGSQEMESFSTEAETIPPWGTDDLTSPAFPSETFNSNLWQWRYDGTIWDVRRCPVSYCDLWSLDQRRKPVLAIQQDIP